MLSRMISLVPAFGPFSQNLRETEEPSECLCSQHTGVCVCVCGPQYAPDAGLRQQQEVLVRRQGDAVGHVERIQEDLHISSSGVVGEETAEVVQLEDLERRPGRFYRAYIEMFH